ncbi:MAG: bifunctional phosphopantothenoylcysteine decarboxylase/phosphopantothenate--cysteine ligase CoaBC [Candidatus Diapherotrites archaeon]|nr:bifunctional phosphopantothenoylcysteine decarboxylase/phosphopantothenate--cysteine ligase CoaBC [Candidatus Diapherotrites archaeon]
MKQFSIKSVKSKSLLGKKITLCISGSVACVRAPELARELIRHGAEVAAVMSESAQKLISPDLLQWATDREVVSKLTGRIEHVRLGAYSDMVLVCPATANTISKISCGIDDTPVTSTVSCALGAGVPVMLVPAMHSSMYNHPIVKENLGKLKSIGVAVINPHIAEGKAKIAENDEIVKRVISTLTPKDLAGLKLVITGGPTYERIDACRGIINQSSGKMSCAIAANASARGAEVTLVYGPAREEPPSNVKLIKVTGAREMIEKTMDAIKSADALISAAAIADYSPISVTNGKLESRKDLKLELKKNPKLVALAKKRFPEKLVVGFKLEETIREDKALECIKESGIDLMVANSTKTIGANNAEAVIMDVKTKTRVNGTKAEVAKEILDALKSKWKKQK